MEGSMNILSPLFILCAFREIVVLVYGGESKPDIDPLDKEDRSVADELYQRVRLLCWVMTEPMYHDTRAKHVQATWGKRCNKIVFMSSFHTDNTSLYIVNLPVHEGKDKLWGKTKEALRYLYEYHKEEADWFLKADDDTYVVVENLRNLLADYDPNAPMYFGCKFKSDDLLEGYMSGNAGYVISREALNRLGSKGLSSPRMCRYDDQGSDDFELGICLHSLGVRAMDSRDQFKRGRFFPFAPQDHLLPHKKADYWYWRYIYYPTTDGLDCCSEHAITFHYIEPEQMYVFDYLIYQLRPYGITYTYEMGHPSNPQFL